MTHTAGLLRSRTGCGVPRKGPRGLSGSAVGRCARFRVGPLAPCPTRRPERSPTQHLVPAASLGVPVFVNRRFPPGASGRALTRAASLVAPGRAGVDGAPC